MIEDALGDEAAGVLPEAIRLVLLRVRVPRYQREVLVALARREGTSVDEIVTRELEDVACAHANELAEAVPSLAIGLGIGLGTGSDNGGDEVRGEALFSAGERRTFPRFDKMFRRTGCGSGLRLDRRLLYRFAGFGARRGRSG